LEEILDAIYRGKINVAIAAKEQGVSSMEMKRLFKNYVSTRPIDPSVWQGDVELSWPWA
jgi:hypothetical protein